MPVTFANVTGFWALAAIPVILLIHLLQRQSRTLPVSTLFLLEQLQRESVRGRKIDRLRNSIPLWLQLLAVLILTWLLVEPRWARDQSVLRIAVVVDSSASMRAFRGEAITALQEHLPSLSASSQQAEYHLIESHLEGASLYTGSDLGELLQVFEDWKPFRTAHDPSASLRVGRSLVGGNGIVLFLTDHEFDDTLRYGARLLAVGSPLENVGFAGVEVEDEDVDVPVWKALVKNYGEQPQTREWFLASGSQRTDPRTVSLNPGETRTLQGRFPQSASEVILHLEPDAFDQDDTLPILVPQRKEISISTQGGNKLDDLFRRVLESTDGFIPPGPENPADLVLASHNPLDTVLEELEVREANSHPDVSIVFLNQGSVSRHFFKGNIITSNHPLMTDLNWQGLICRNSPGIPMQEGDLTLLWQGERPLIYLRNGMGKLQLFLNFDIGTSNADELPAFIILIHRFIEIIRESKINEEKVNLELHQAIDLAHQLGAEAQPLVLRESDLLETTYPLNRTRYLRAPSEPMFFTITQGENSLLRASAHFADTREADFSDAITTDDLTGLKADTVREQTQADHWWQLWILGLVLLAIGCWYFIHRPLPEAIPSQA